MPIYIYETIPADGGDAVRFEVMQRVAEPALTQHPETGAPVRRVITAPALVLKHSSRGERNILSSENLSRNGFVRYKRAGDGTYERTGGKAGPKRISSH